MAPPDETSVKEVLAPTKDAEVENADEHKCAEEEDVSTLRSSSLDDIGDEDANQEVNQRVNQELNRESNQEVNEEGNQEVNQEGNQEVNQEVDQEVNRELNQELNQVVNQGVNQKVKKRLPCTHWSKEEKKIVRDIIDNHIISPETSKLSLGELDKYSVKKLAEAGFVRPESGVRFFRGKQPCEVDYSKVCDLVANMPESIRAMETREKCERAAVRARENCEKVAAKASEPVRRRSTVPFQSASEL